MLNSEEGTVEAFYREMQRIVPSEQQAERCLNPVGLPGGPLQPKGMDHSGVCIAQKLGGTASHSP